MPPFTGSDWNPRRSQVVTFVLQQPNKFYTINIHDHLHEHRKKIVEINITKEQGRSLSVNFNNELKQRRRNKMFQIAQESKHNKDGLIHIVAF